MVGRYPTIKLIRARPLPRPQVPKDPCAFTPAPEDAVVPSSITTRFQELSQSGGYVNELLLTLPPRYSSEDFHAQLACLNPAASVRSEPGSNSSKKLFSGL